MKKSLLLVVAVFVFAGCVDQQVTEEEPVAEETTPEIVLDYENEYFGLTFPSEYMIGKNERLIAPKEAGAFPFVGYGVSDEEHLTQAQLLEKAEELIENLCSEADGCSEMTSNENVELDGVLGVRITTHLEGRSLGPVTEGYIKAYKYWFSNNDKTIIIGASATDLEDPENTEKVFDEIMQTIEFK